MPAATQPRMPPPSIASAILNPSSRRPGTEPAARRACIAAATGCRRRGPPLAPSAARRAEELPRTSSCEYLTPEASSSRCLADHAPCAAAHGPDPHPPLLARSAARPGRPAPARRGASVLRRPAGRRPPPVGAPPLSAEGAASRRPFRPAWHGAQLTTDPASHPAGRQDFGTGSRSLPRLAWDALLVGSILNTGKGTSVLLDLWAREPMGERASAPPTAEKLFVPSMLIVASRGGSLYT
eukprot:scaffold10483_cov112-Isochrysis_galbana.AAC.2